MFCLLYKHQWNTKPFYFNIFNGLKVERVVTKHGRSTWKKYMDENQIHLIKSKMMAPRILDSEESQL